MTLSPTTEFQVRRLENNWVVASEKIEKKKEREKGEGGLNELFS